MSQVDERGQPMAAVLCPRPVGRYRRELVTLTALTTLSATLAVLNAESAGAAPTTTSTSRPPKKSTASGAVTPSPGPASPAHQPKVVDEGWTSYSHWTKDDSGVTTQQLF